MTRMEAARRARKLNQTQVAALANISAGDVSKYERRRCAPYPNHASRLATVLEIPADELLLEVEVAQPALHSARG